MLFAQHLPAGSAKRAAAGLSGRQNEMPKSKNKPKKLVRTKKKKKKDPFVDKLKADLKKRRKALREAMRISY